MIVDYSECLEDLREACVTLHRRAETDRSMKHAVGQVARAYHRLRVRAADFAETRASA